MDEPKLIVLGLDGAGFELIDEYIEDLPNLKMLKEKGTYADMKSCLPPVTCPNWKCYSTGKNPAKLGMFWWQNISFKERKEYLPYARFNKENEIWDYLSVIGKKVAVINMPTTYPPKKVKGIFISGGAGAMGNKYTEPQELKKEIIKKYGYRLRADKTSTYTYSEKEVYDDCMDVITRKFNLLKDIISGKKYDFIHFTIFHINTLQHNFWNSRESTKKAWIYIDSQIGEILQHKDYNLMLMSDHGANGINTVFNINKWLEQEGFLKIKRGWVYSIKKKLNLHSILKVTALFGLNKHVLERIVPQKIKIKLIDILPTEQEFKRKTEIIDWAKTIAIASGQGPVYIKKVPGYNHIRQEIQNKVEKLEHNGQKVIKKAHLKEELYSGKYFEEAPDLLLDQNKGVHINGAYSEKRDIFEKPTNWKGENKRHGIFLAYGSIFKNLKKINEMSILDLAPTILYFFGFDKKGDMDGRALTEIFNKKIEIKQTNIEQENLKKKIAELKL